MEGIKEMADIKCPNCGEIFQVDESDYAQIVKQIRDKEFEEELKRREEVLNDKSQRELEIARLMLLHQLYFLQVRVIRKTMLINFIFPKRLNTL